MTKNKKPAMRATTPTLPTAPLPSFPAIDAPLSPQRAFLVQFRMGAGQDSVHFVGRVEHVVSGDTARFHTAEELLAFIKQILTAQDKGGNGI